MGTTTYHYSDNTYSKYTLNASNYLTYKNTSSQYELITSITIKLGVAENGDYYNAGEEVTGTGSSLPVTLTCGSSTATKTISTIVKTVKYDGGKSYPDYSECGSYTFTFNTPIVVSAGSSVTITITKSNANVLIHGTRSLNVIQGGVVRINTNGTSSGWKMAIPYINTNGTSSGWKPAIAYINTDGKSTGWKICG